jgi:hypothetical protein
MEPESEPVEPEGDSKPVTTTKCPSCGQDNDIDAVACAGDVCKLYLKTELECLRAIDVSLRTVKHIAIWLVLSIIVAVVGAFLLLDAIMRAARS